MKIKEDGPVAGSPTNQTSGVEGPVKPIKDKNQFRRILDIKKKKSKAQ